MTKIERALQRTTDTRALVIGPDALEQSARMFGSLFAGRRAVIVTDETTWRIAGERVAACFSAAGIGQDAPHVFRFRDSFAEWSLIEELESCLRATDAIPVAVGSGVINDLTKLSAHRCGRRYLCVATAASMDGYTAYGASITCMGNKRTFDCPAPYGVVFDPVIAARAPKATSASGYADLIAKVPAGADWLIADAIGVEPIHAFAFGVVQEGLAEALADPAGIYNGDVRKIERLAEGLLLSGFAMQAAQSSRPASGIEHQFSHFWDMENLEFEGKHVSHGFKVGIGTLASTAFLELLLEAPLSDLNVDACVSRWKSWEETRDDILRIFEGKPGFIDRALKETEGKYVDRETLRSQLRRLKVCWPDLRVRIRKQIIPFDEVRRRLEAVGAPCEPEQIGVTRMRLRDTFAKIPYMCSRFTGVDVAYRCGYMESWLDRLFGRGGVWDVAASRE